MSPGTEGSLSAHLMGPGPRRSPNGGRGVPSPQACLDPCTPCPQADCLWERGLESPREGSPVSLLRSLSHVSCGSGRS